MLQKQLYAQVASPSILDILKLKENYLNLLAKKIENIQKIIDDSDKSKPQIVPYINKSLFLWTEITLTNLWPLLATTFLTSTELLKTSN